jgi:2-haloacid dehalogenase
LNVRAGRIGFSKLDVLHRRNLDLILPRFGLAALAEDDRCALNFAWHRLDAWPDVADGLRRLKQRFWLAPVSNGNISLMVDLARRNGFPWDAILGPEIAGTTSRSRASIWPPPKRSTSSPANA